MGRKKIEMKKISNKNALEITFSKRRQGLFRKAGDLCLRNDAQIAIITFSPGDRPFTFGHPSADSVIDRYYYPWNKYWTSRMPRPPVSILEEDEKFKFRLENWRNPLKEWGYMNLNSLGVGSDEDEKIMHQTNRRSIEFELDREPMPELDEMKMRESCTKDFLANWK